MAKRKKTSAKKNGKALTKRRPVGAPTLRDTARVKGILNAIKSGLPIESACHFVGIGEKTLYNWLQKDPELVQQVKQARSEREEQLVGKVFEKDAKFLLKNHNPRVWKEEFTVDGHLTHEFVLNLDDGKEKKFDF